MRWSLAVVLAAVALLLSLRVDAQYSCSPATCQPPSCTCANIVPPGGMAVVNAPQFIQIALSGLLDDTVMDALKPILYTTTARDATGCKPRVTVYTTVFKANFTTLQRLDREHNEIALSGVSDLTDTTSSLQRWSDELRRSEIYIEESGLIDPNTFQGARAANYLYNNWYFNIAKGERSLLYDCSITEVYKSTASLNSMSTAPGNWIWPYTLQNGSAQPCGTPGLGGCPTAVAGLWEIPVHYMMTSTTAGYADKYPGTASSLLSLLQVNFNDHYTGSRAPFTINIDGAWLAANPTVRATAIANFLSWAATYSNVFFATGSQIIQFMQSPIPANQLTTQPYMQCPSYTPTSATAEVCDGIDNNLNGEVDEVGVRRCSYNGNRLWTCLTSCPSYFPSVCGDGVCGGDETCGLCAADCGVCAPAWFAPVIANQTDNWGNGGCLNFIIDNTGYANLANYWVVRFSASASIAVSGSWGGSCVKYTNDFVCKPDSALYDNVYPNVKNPVMGVCFSDKLEQLITTPLDQLFYTMYSVMFSRACDREGCELVCGDGTCQPLNLETTVTCPADCALVYQQCGNGVCEQHLGESCGNCVADCGVCALCGDGLCSWQKENCTTCTADCGQCANPSDSSFLLYNCNPATCLLPDCFCAGTVPPGGLTLSQTPQFVMLSFDDALNELVFPYIDDLLHNTPARDMTGCGPRATFFITSLYTNFKMVQEFYTQGHEIGDHTTSHTTGKNQSFTRWHDELATCYDELVRLANIPPADLIGMRAPFFLATKHMYNIGRNELGIQFDSSLAESYGSPPFQRSTYPGQILWPYTLQNGSAVACGLEGLAECPPALPGMWSMPMFDLHNLNQPVATMDPSDTPENLLKLYKNNFDDHYTGSKAPFTINLHGVWFVNDPRRVEMLRNLFAYMATKPGVKFATFGQVVRWMKNPVPLAQIPTTPWLKCVSPNPSSPTPEVCDGIDNNLNGETDEGVGFDCGYPEGSIRTCTGPCPTYFTSVCGDNFCGGAESCATCPDDCGVCGPPINGTVYWNTTSFWPGGGCIALTMVNTVPTRAVRWWITRLKLNPNARITSTWGGDSALRFSGDYTVTPSRYTRSIKLGGINNQTGFCYTSGAKDRPNSIVLSVNTLLYTSPCDTPNYTCPDACGNGVCDPSETAQMCGLDCYFDPRFKDCGNGKCDNNETCSVCPGDCGQCAYWMGGTFQFNVTSRWTTGTCLSPTVNNNLYPYTAMSWELWVRTPLQSGVRTLKVTTSWATSLTLDEIVTPGYDTYILRPFPYNSIIPLDSKYTDLGFCMEYPAGTDPYTLVHVDALLFRDACTTNCTGVIPGRKVAVGPLVGPIISEAKDFSLQFNVPMPRDNELQIYIDGVKNDLVAALNMDPSRLLITGVKAVPFTGYVSISVRLLPLMSSTWQTDAVPSANDYYMMILSQLATPQSPLLLGSHTVFLDRTQKPVATSVSLELCAINKWQLQGTCLIESISEDKLPIMEILTVLGVLMAFFTIGAILKFMCVCTRLNDVTKGGDVARSLRKWKAGLIANKPVPAAGFTKLPDQYDPTDSSAQYPNPHPRLHANKDEEPVDQEMVTHTVYHTEMPGDEVVQEPPVQAPVDPAVTINLNSGMFASDLQGDSAAPPASNDTFIQQEADDDNMSVQQGRGGMHTSPSQQHLLGSR